MKWIFKEVAVLNNLISNRLNEVSGFQAVVGAIGDFTINSKKSSCCYVTGSENCRRHVKMNKHIIQAIT